MGTHPRPTTTRILTLLALASLLLLFVLPGEATAASHRRLPRSSPTAVAAQFERQIRQLSKQSVGGFQKKGPWTIDLLWQGPINGWGGVFGVAASYEASKYSRIKSFKEISNGGDATTEVTQLENAVATRPSAIVIQPGGVGVEGATTLAIKDKIPVILCAENLPNNKTFSTMVNANDVTIATGMAKYIVQELKGQGNVLMLGGNPTYESTQIYRAAGLAVFDKNPKIHIVGTYYANYNIETAKEDVLAFLAKGIKVNAVFSDGTEAAVGAIEAYAQEHLKMPIFAGDNVLNGFLRLAIEYHIKFYGAPLAPAMSAPCVDTAVKLLEGKRVKRFINVADVLPDSKPYTNADAKSHYVSSMNDNFVPPAVGPLRLYVKAGFGR